MTHAPDDPLDLELRGIIADAEALEPVSRTRPEAFYEGKDGLVRRLKDFYDDLREAAAASRAPRRTTVFQAGVIARQGRVIPVQRRSGR